MSELDVRHEALDPYPWYHAMAASRGPQFDPRGETWGIFRYDEIVEALRDPDTFSSHAPSSASAALSSTVVLRDPPHHRALRQSLVGWFSARAAARLADRVGVVARELVEDLADGGGGDFVRDVAVPLPIIVMADVLGVPRADFRMFKHWCDNAASNGQAADDGTLYFDRDTFVRARESWGSDEVMDYFESLASTRRSDPQEDLLSALAAAEVDGRLLTTRELAASCFQVLLAGNETTTNLMGNALRCLDERPEAWAALRADPSLVPSMLEEVLRFRSSVHGVVRRVTRDLTWHGAELPAESLVMLWLAAGNRDPQVFERADEFDIRRSPNRHLAFGQGIHFCIGASLARLEAKVLFELMTERFSEVSVTSEADDLTPLASVTLSGVTELPVAVVSV